MKHWQSIGKKIPPGYKDRVRRAELLFYYHPVYDPVAQRIAHFSRYSSADEADGHHLPVATADELSNLGGESDILANAPENYSGGVADICEGRVSRIDFSVIQPVLPWELPAIAALSHRIPQTSQKSASWGLRRNLANILRDSGVVGAASTPSRVPNTIFSGVQKMRPAASSFQVSSNGPVSLMATSVPSLSAKLGRPANGVNQSFLSRRATVPNASSKAIDSDKIDLPKSKLSRSSTNVSPVISVLQEPCGSIAPGFKPVSICEEPRRASRDIFDLVSDDDCSRFSDKDSVVSKDDDSIIFSFHSDQQGTFAELMEEHEEQSRSNGRSPLVDVSTTKLNELNFQIRSGDDSPLRLKCETQISASIAKMECSVDYNMLQKSAELKPVSIDFGMWTPPANRENSNSSFIDCSQTVKPSADLVEIGDHIGEKCEINFKIVQPVIVEQVYMEIAASIRPNSNYEREIIDISTVESSRESKLNVITESSDKLVDSLQSNKRKLSEISRIQSVIISADARGSKRKKTGKTMTVASIKSFFVSTKI